MFAPSDCAQIVRLLVTLLFTSTLMPELAASSTPSQSMRFTSPLTLMRASFVTLPSTTYQPFDSSVWPV